MENSLGAAFQSAMSFRSEFGQEHGGGPLYSVRLARTMNNQSKQGSIRVVALTPAALVLNKLFFITFDPLSGTLASLATYSVGFVARPFGIIIGHYGEEDWTSLRRAWRPLHDAMTSRPSVFPTNPMCK